MNTARVLDVGSGLKPRGDVNIDLYIESIHRRGGKGPPIDVDNTPEFHEMDALNMTFPDRSFDEVRCYHLMEHIPFPQCWDLLKECWRVTNRHLVVEVPSRYWLKFGTLKRSPVHVANFDKKILEKGVEHHLGTRNYEVVTKYRGIFHKMIPFPYWPHLVRLDVWRY